MLSCDLYMVCWVKCHEHESIAAGVTENLEAVGDTAGYLMPEVDSHMPVSLCDTRKHDS